MMQGTCPPPCGKFFISKQPKTYCSLACCIAARRAVAALPASEKPPIPKQVEVPCATCGFIMHLRPSLIKRNKKTCSRLCYRKYMTARFDAHIGSVISLPLLTNYDEFLTRKLLPCLVPNCNWVGHNLSLHMYQTHAIRARDFKKLAGFNRSTGVIGAEMQLALQLRGGKGSSTVPARKVNKLPGKAPDGYASKEGKEHRIKAMALRTAKEK